MTETLTLKDGTTLVQTTSVIAEDDTIKHPGNVVHEHDDILWLPERQVTVAHTYVEQAAPPPPPPGGGPHLPPSFVVGAKLWDGAANGWAEFSRARGTNGSMNGVQTDAQCVSIDSNNVAHLSLKNLNGNVRGGFMSTDSNDGGKGYNLPDKSILEWDAAVPFTAWCALWASGKNWPAGGEEDVIEILGNKDTTNYHATTGSGNFGAGAGSQSNQRRFVTLVRDTTTYTVFWGGVFVKQYTGTDHGALQSIIMNVGQGQVGTVMDIYACGVWALG